MALKDVSMDKLTDVAKEVEKAVDVDKVTKAAVKDGKVDLKAAAEAVSKEVSADEAKSIMNKAKDLLGK